MQFGARAYAKNLTQEELEEAIDYVHIHGRKVHLTVNTLLKDKEIDQLYEYLKPYYERGLDGVIVQDVGAASYIREYFPGLAVHASTQMTITGRRGASFMKSQGIVRCGAGQELSLEEIRIMKEETGLEVECFVHGALCYCYSGQCLLKQHDWRQKRQPWPVRAAMQASLQRGGRPALRSDELEGSMYH